MRADNEANVRVAPQPSASRLRLLNRMAGLSSDKKAVAGVAIAVLVLFILLSILIILSFSFISFEYIGFKKSILNNKVDKSKAYGMGRYFWGPLYEPILFPAIYQRIVFDNYELDLYSKKGLEFQLNCDIYYRLNESLLAETFTHFGMAYHRRFIDVIKASIKNSGPLYTVDQFIVDRANITEVMRYEINKDLENFYLNIELDKFIFLTINFPYSIREKFLNTAIQTLQNEQAQLQQDVDMIVKGTEKLIAEFDANITIVAQTAYAKKEQMIDTANAQAERIVQNATGAGLYMVIEALKGANNNSDLTPQQYTTLFNMFTVIDNPNTPFILDGDANVFINTN